MEYLCIGLNHQKSPLALRERAAFTLAELDSALRQLNVYASIQEGMILSTCNRTEIYSATNQAETAVQSIKLFLQDTKGLSQAELNPYLYQYSDLSAVTHLFRVASSLDSMVIGETQISHQIKKAYELALQSKVTGLYLNSFFNRALAVAKQVRSETDISVGIVSVGSMAVKLAQRLFGSLEQKEVCVMGAGEGAKSILEHLQGVGIKRLVCINRTIARAEALAQQYQAESAPLSALKELLISSDMVIGSIDAEEPVISVELMREVMATRKHRVLFLIDLGVPRNMSAGLGALDNIFLYNIDDLTQVLLENREQRRMEALKADEIIVREAHLFHHEITSHHQTLLSLNKKAEEIREKELQRTLAKMPHLSEHDQQTIAKMSSVIVKKILHDPILGLRKSSLDGDKDAHSLLKKLFKLEEL